jgi:transcriptional regulator with XRE-family HTH domain
MKYCFDSNKLRKLRLKNNVSQEELAHKTGTNQCVISDIENGKIKNPSFCLVAKISWFLKIEMDYFMVLCEPFSEE